MNSQNKRFLDYANMVVWINTIELIFPNCRAFVATGTVQVPITFLAFHSLIESKSDVDKLL